jgi:hypothetical protein
VKDETPRGPSEGEPAPEGTSPWSRVGDAARSIARELRSPATLSELVAAATVVALPIIVLWPWLRDRSTYGFHDWDVQTSHRYLVKKTLLEFGQFPGWNPYACGGFPAWGYVESGTIVVSPWLPLYLFADMRLALRAEVLGMAWLGAVGTYVLAGHFTKSPAARALVVAVFAVNGRWALQAAAGHTWHLAYALLPWCFSLFESARKGRLSAKGVGALGAAFAGLVYAGGIYPLPHTVLAVGLWAIGCALVERSAKPLLVLALGGVSALGLAAPKLLPLLATFSRAPRTIESTEVLDLGSFFTLLTSRDQAFYSRPAQVAPYGWHEWGMYIGLPATLGLAVGLLVVGGKRETILKVLAVLFGLLGFGAFHEDAPWTWLHAHVPPFGSQHVPSRFLYPAVLFAGLVLAAGLGRLVEKRPRAELALALVALAVGVDVASVAELPMKDAMWMRAPDRIPTDRPFSFATDPPYQYKRADWAGPMYLAMIANTGVIRCYGAPPFEGIGALARTDPRYRGEVELSGGGAAKLERWSPNEVELSVSGAPRGAMLVYNMNFDRGWSASARVGGHREVLEVRPTRDRLSVSLPEGVTSVTLSYTPPRLHLGLALACLTSLALAALQVRSRRRR